MSRVHIFSNGSQAGDWATSNCERCMKSAPAGWWPTCEIEAALVEAYFTGWVSQEIATRAGVTDEPTYVWPCGEAEWTDEWKAELIRRRKAFVEEVQRNFIPEGGCNNAR